MYTVHDRALTRDGLTHLEREGSTYTALGPDMHVLPQFEWARAAALSPRAHLWTCWLVLCWNARRSRMDHADMEAVLYLSCRSGTYLTCWGTGRPLNRRRPSRRARRSSRGCTAGPPHRSPVHTASACTRAQIVSGAKGEQVCIWHKQICAGAQQGPLVGRELVAVEGVGEWERERCRGGGA